MNLIVDPSLTIQLFTAAENAGSRLPDTASSQSAVCSAIPAVRMLIMILLAFNDSKRTVELLKKDEPRHFMGEGPA